MYKKQSSVSHSSTESEIIALDAGLRMDGLPAIDLWDIVQGVQKNWFFLIQNRYFWRKRAKMCKTFLARGILRKMSRYGHVDFLLLS